MWSQGAHWAQFHGVFMSDARMRWFGARNAVVAFSAIALSAMPVGATTLAEAIASVRASNPEIAAQRAQISGDIAQIAILRAPARPRIQASGTFTQGTRGANVSSGFDRTFDGTVLASLPLYDGGAVHYGVSAQRALVSGSEADAVAMENRVIADAITAYLDIIRDREIVALTEENLRVLDRDLSASHDRFGAGDVTRTDVAQTEARHAMAVSQLTDAQTQLTGSEDNYRRVVGSDPGELVVPPALPMLPVDLNNVADAAIARDPRLVSAQANVQAATIGISTARAAARPTLTVSGGGEYHNYSQSPVGYLDQRGEGAQAGATLSYPIYQGGLVRGQIQQARAAADKAKFDRETTSRTIVSEASTALVRYEASLKTIAENERAVKFENDALVGVQIEAKGGERSVLDVLNAQMELLNAQITLANARHDSYLAGIGVMTVLNLLHCLDHPSPDGSCK
jgi:outer membrane protein